MFFTVQIWATNITHKPVHINTLRPQLLLHLVLQKHLTAMQPWATAEQIKVRRQHRPVIFCQCGQNQHTWVSNLSKNNVVLVPLSILTLLLCAHMLTTTSKYQIQCHQPVSSQRGPKNTTTPFKSPIMQNQCLNMYSQRTYIVLNFGFGCLSMPPDKSFLESTMVQNRTWNHHLSCPFIIKYSVQYNG